MFKSPATLPPATHAFRPERRSPAPGLLDSLSRMASVAVLRIAVPHRRRMDRFVCLVAGHGKTFGPMPDARIKEAAGRVRSRLYRGGMAMDTVAMSFALVREVAARTLAMAHFPTQLIGGWILLQGMVAEMETGEGKTLTATLAAATAALAGIPVHIITVNDYLTARDAQWMGPVYQALGLSVGCIVHGMTSRDRRHAYGGDITYCTNKEVAFDYLRDWLTLEGKVNPLRLQAEHLHGRGARADRLLLRGLHFGIVDEADSVLIDEARTPLIISRVSETGDEALFYGQALAMARDLQSGVHFRIDPSRRTVELTAEGRQRIQERAGRNGPLWTGVVRREEIVRLALTALHLFDRDDAYLVQDGKVLIVDEFTGRIMADRSYERGLHQLIEIKEGCQVTRRPETMARISYQRFFKRYLHLAGMTGTAREVKAELAAIYGLAVVCVPTNRPMQRRALPDRVLPGQDQKWQAVIERIDDMHRRKRPVLVGTRSVAASEHTSGLLSQRGLAHQVLNAKQDREEAEIIAQAGQSGAITVATSMAGRGTDIRLGAGVAEGGGLHVILTERHEAGRIDRQLAGRCGRQGDPGSHEAILSMEDPLLVAGGPGWLGRLASLLLRFGWKGWTRFAARAHVRAQKKVEGRHYRIRKTLYKEDTRRGDMLSFSGRSE